MFKFFMARLLLLVLAVERLKLYLERFIAVLADDALGLIRMPQSGCGRIVLVNFPSFILEGKMRRGGSHPCKMCSKSKWASVSGFEASFKMDVKFSNRHIHSEV